MAKQDVRGAGPKMRPDAEGAARGTSSGSERAAPTDAIATEASGRAVGQAQDTWGNALVGAAMHGISFDGLGHTIAGTIGLAVGGVDPSQQLDSNTSLNEIMRQRAARKAAQAGRCERENPALARLARPSGGQPLPDLQRVRFEAAFGHDFSKVRIHTDAAAARAAEALQAHALALGADLFFGAGEWAPGSAKTDRLLAHELTHVLQHDEGRLPSGGGVSDPSDATEREAYANEARIVGAIDRFEALSGRLPGGVAGTVRAHLDGDVSRDEGPGHDLDAMAAELGAPSWWGTRDRAPGDSANGLEMSPILRDAAPEKPKAEVRAAAPKVLKVEPVDPAIAARKAFEDAMAPLRPAIAVLPTVGELGTPSAAFARATSRLGGEVGRQLGAAARKLRERLEARIDEMSRGMDALLDGAASEGWSRVEETRTTLAESAPAADPAAAPVAEAPAAALEAIAATSEQGAERARKMGGADVPVAEGAPPDPRREAALAAAAEIEALEEQATALLRGDPAAGVDEVAGLARRTAEEVEGAAVGLAERATATRDALTEALNAALDEAATLLDGSVDEGGVAEIEARLADLEARAMARFVEVQSGWTEAADALGEGLVSEEVQLDQAVPAAPVDAAAVQAALQAGIEGILAELPKRMAEAAAPEPEEGEEPKGKEPLDAAGQARAALQALSPEGAVAPAERAPEAVGFPPTAASEEVVALAEKPAAVGGTPTAANEEEKPGAVGGTPTAAGDAVGGAPGAEVAPEAVAPLVSGKGPVGKALAKALPGMPDATAPAADPAAEAEALKAEQESLQARMDVLSAKIETNQAKQEEIGVEVEEIEEESGEKREELEAREKDLNARAERAQKKGQKARSPADDSTVQGLKRELEIDLPEDKEELDEESEALREEREELDAEREKVGERLSAVGKRLQELQPKGGGGGGAAPPGGPPAEANIAKTSAKLAGILESKAKPKVEKELQTAEKAVETIEEALQTLETRLKTSQGALEAAKGTIGTASGAVSTATKELATRAQALKDEAAAEERAPVANASDAQWAQINGRLNAARGQLKAAESARDKEIGIQEKIAEDQKTKRKELADAEKKAEEAKEKVTTLDTAIAGLAGAGDPTWEAIAAEFGVACPPVALAPGESNEEHGHAKPPEEEKKEEEKPAEEAKDPKKEEPKKEEEPEKKKEEPEKSKEELEKEAKQKKDDAVMLEVSSALKLAPEERKARFAELAKKHELTEAQMREIRDQRVTGAQERLAQAMRSGKLPHEAGLSKAEWEAIQADTDRRKLEQQAMAMTGSTNGAEAVDKLHAMGASRKMAPAELVAHLERVDPAKLPPEMQAAAKVARAAKEKEIADLTDETAKETAQKAYDKEKEAANATEKDHQDTQELAESLDCSPDEAKTYIDRVVEASGGSRADAAAALKSRKKGDKSLTPAETQAELAKIHALPPKERGAALAALAANVDPKTLVGATMVPSETDPDGLIDGPMGNESLRNQIAEIGKLPKDQQAAAWRDLGAKTGVDHKKLYAANKRLERKQGAHDQYFAIQNDNTLEQSEKDKKIAELAARLELPVDKLKSSAAEKLERTKKKLDASSGWVKGLVGDGTSPDAMKSINNDLRDGKITPEQARAKLAKMAKDTGIPEADLQALQGHLRLKDQAEEWSKKLKIKPAGKASDYVARKAREEGIRPDQVLEWLRYADPEKMSAEDKAAGASVGEWHEKNPTKAERKEQEAREEAGLGKDGAAIRVEHDPVKAESLTGKAREDYDAMKAAEKEIRDELDDTFVDEKAIVAKLESMPKEQRAALMRAFPDLRKKLVDEINNNVATTKGAAEEKAALAKLARDQMSEATAYNEVLSTYGEGGANAAGRKEAEAKKAWACKVQEETIAAKEAATALDMPLVEARANLQAYALGTGKTYAQAVAQLKSDPAKAPREVLREAYAAKTAQGGPSEPLKRRLAQINQLPAGERDAALEQLKGASGLTDADLKGANEVMGRDNAVAKAIHELRNLPADEQATERKKIAEKYELPVEDLDTIYQASLTATTNVIPPDLMAKAISGSPKDVQAHAKQIAAETHLPIDEVLRAIQARRDVAFAGGPNAAKLPEEDLSALKKHGADCNKSPEEMLDYLMRARDDLLPPELLKLKADLKKSLRDPETGVDYEVVRTEAENKALEKLRAKADDPAYLDRASALKQALLDEDADAVKGALAKMNPAERALFQEQWAAEARMAAEKGEEMPSFDVAMDDAVDSVFEDVGIVSSDADQILAEIPDSSVAAEKELLEAVKGVDRKDPGYTDASEAMAKELRNGADADADVIKEQLAKMTPAQRVAFLEDYQALQNHAAQTNLSNDEHTLPNLQDVLGDDPEALRWIVDAQRIAATGIAAADAAETKKVEEARRIATEAAEALDMDRRSAYRLVTQMAEDQRLSPANALRFLKNEPLVDDAEDNLPAFVKSQIKELEKDWKKGDPAAEDKDKIGGHSLNTKKVEEQAALLEELGNGGSMSPAQINAILQKCNPRELKELDAKLGGKLRSIVDAQLNRETTAGDVVVAVLTPGAALAMSEDDRQAGTQIGNALHGMDDFAAEQQDLVLIGDVATMDPRASADPNTPEGLAQRMAWAATLPPAQRIKAFNALREQLPEAGMGARQIVGAYLNGEQPVTEDGMLTKRLLAEVQRIELLPADERAAALETLAAMTGREPEALRLAAEQTEERLVFANEMHTIEALPPDKRLDKLNELSERTGMSLDELQAAYDDALASGQIEKAPKPVSKEVALQLDEIKLMADPAARKAALQALAEHNGLTQADLMKHLETRLAENRKRRAEIAGQRKAGQKLGDLLDKGDKEQIAKTLESYRGKPDELKKIAEQVGGIEALRAKLGSAFDEDSDEYLDLGQILTEADRCTAEPGLPDGVGPELADELNALRAANPDDWKAALQAKHPDLTEADLDALEAHATWKKGKFDRQVGYAQERFDKELNSDWIADDRIAQLMKSTPPDVLLALADKLAPERDLVAEVQAGVGDDLGSDFGQLVEDGRKVAKLPVAERAAAQRDLRVDYKAKQLAEEFDATFYADDARIAELLRDCTPEELKLLNARFGGELESKIEENTGGISLGDVVGGVVLVALAPMGPMAAVIALSVREQLVDAELDQDLLTLQAKIRNGDVDYAKSPEERFPLVDAKVTRALDELQSELHKDLWTSDGDVIGALKGLNPRELQEVVKKYEAEHGGSGALMEKLRQSLGDDAYAQAVALVDGADDAMSGTDRAKEMQDRCRELAIADRLKELRKSPEHQGKSEFELYEIIDREGGRIDQMAAERVKKIKDSANDIFKAVDGWWNNDTDAMLKTMAGLSPEDTEMVKIEYRRHFGRDFDLDVRSEMGFYNREEMQVAERLMSSDPDTRVEGLRLYLLEDYRMFEVEDEDMIFDTLAKMSVEERTKLVSGADGKIFLDRLKDQLGENERLMVDAYVRVNPETGLADANPAIVAAAKMKMQIHGSGDLWDVSCFGTKEEELIAELSDLTPAQVREAELYYNQHLSEDGGTFVSDLKSDFGDGRDWQIVEAELRGDKVGADAHRLKWATQEEGLLQYLGYAELAGTDEQLLEQVLTAGKEGKGGRNEAHLAAVRGRFDHLFGGEEGRYAKEDAGDSRDALTRMLDEETTGIENVYFRQLAAKGEADDAVTLLYAVDGAGTDEDKLKKVLGKVQKMTKAERDAFRDEFRAMSKELLGVDQSLDDWVSSETSGGENFDMKLLLMGEPKTPEEKLAIARMRWDFERGEGSGFGNFVMGALDATGGSNAAEILGANMAELEACFDEKGQLLPGAAERFDEVVDWAEMDVATYRATKDSVAESIGNTVAAVAAIAAGIATAGAAWYIMAAAAAAAAAAGTMFKAAIKGNSYGWEEGLADVGAIAVSALTAGMGGSFEALEKMAKLATGLQKYALLALKGAIEGAIESFLNAVLSSEQALAQGDVAFLKHILKSTAIGAFNGGAGAVAGELLKDGNIGGRLDRIESGNPLAHPASEHFALKYANGMAKATMTTAMDPSNWEAWADGKELSLADVKKIFIMPALSAAADVMATRNKEYDPKKMEADARAEAEKTRGEMETLRAKRDDLTDPDEIEALDAQLAAMKKTFERQREILEWTIEDNKVLKEREEAKERITAGMDRPAPAGDGVDPVENAGRTSAMRDYVQQMDDAPAAMRPGELSDAGFGDNGPLSQRPGELSDAGFGDNGPVSMRPQELEDAGYGGNGPAAMRPGELSDAGFGDNGPVSQRPGELAGETDPAPASMRPEQLAGGDEEAPASMRSEELAGGPDDGPAAMGPQSLEDGGFGSNGPASMRPGELAGETEPAPASMRPEQLAGGDEEAPASMRPQELAGGGEEAPGSMGPQSLEDGGFGSNGPAAMSPQSLEDAGFGSNGPASMGPGELEDAGVGGDPDVVVNRIVDVGEEPNGVVVNRVVDVGEEPNGVVVNRIVDVGEEAVAVHPIIDVGPDSQALTRALAADLPEEAAAALSERSAAASAEVFAEPANRAPVQEIFSDLPDSAEVRAAHAGQLVDTFGGDFVAAMKAFGGQDAPTVEEALLLHRDQAAREALSGDPKLAALVPTLDQDDPTLYVDVGTELTDATRAELKRLGIDVVEDDARATLARLDLALGPPDAETRHGDPGAVDVIRNVDVEEDGGKAPSRGAPYEEVGDEALGTQRRLDNTDRVMEREALSTLRESILDDAEAALSDDPAAAKAKIQAVADLFRDTPGQEAIARAIEFETDPRAALEAARALNAFGRILDLDPNGLTPDQVTVAVKGLYQLQKVEIDFLKVAAEEGLEAARAKHPHLAYRKVYDADGLAALFEGKYAGGIAGYVANAANTDGLTAQQAIGRLALGYIGKDKAGDPYVSPFYAFDGEGFTPDDTVAILDFAANAERVDAAKIPVHPVILAQIYAMANGTGVEADQARALLGRVHTVDHAEPDLYLEPLAPGVQGPRAPIDRDFLNPHTGMGASRSGMGDLMWGEGDSSAINVEQKMHNSQAQKVGKGDQVAILDGNGNRTPVATYDGARWHLEPGAEHVLTPSQLAKLRQWTAPK